MKSSAKNINLTSVDDLFSTEESRADANRERVMEILKMTCGMHLSGSGYSSLPSMARNG